MGRSHYVLCLFSIFSALGFLAAVAHAEIGKRYYRITSGTGFYVSNMGYIVTNEHVVRGCSKVMIRGEGINDTAAEVRALDTNNDLALIYTSHSAPQSAPLRDTTDGMRAGDPVTVMGYPGEAGITGKYTVVNSEIVDVQGPQGHPEWLQFADAARQGNSGGPLLDESGNVVGVIVGKGQMFEVNKSNGQQRLVRKADEAITLATVKDFLHSNGVYYRNVSSGVRLDRWRVEQQARDFVLNVQCHKQVTTEQARAENASLRLVEMHEDVPLAYRHNR